MQPPKLNQNLQYELPQLPAAGAVAPDYGLNNWQVMNNLGKFNAGQFGNAAAGADGNAVVLVVNNNNNGVAAAGNQNGDNEQSALYTIQGVLQTYNIDGREDAIYGLLSATMDNQAAAFTHYFAKVLGVDSNVASLGAPHNGGQSSQRIDINAIFGTGYNNTISCVGGNQNNAQRLTNINTHANGFFIWIAKALNPANGMPVEVRRELLQTIKQNLQGKTVVANNAVDPLPANNIRAKDAIVGLVQEIHKNPKLSNLLPVNGWGVHNIHNAGGGNGFDNLNGGSREIRQLDLIRRRIAYNRAGNAAVNGFGANNAAGAAGAVVANNIHDDAIAEVNTNSWQGDVKYTEAQVPHNPFIMSIQKRMADPHIGLQHKKAYLAALQNAMNTAHVANGNAWPTTQPQYDTFMHSVASEMARQFPGKFQIGGGDIADADANVVKAKTIAVEALYNAIGGNGDITTAVNAVKSANIVQPIQKIQGGYDYDSGRAITPVQHAMHVLSEIAKSADADKETKFTMLLSKLDPMLKGLPNQVGVRREDLAIAVKKFGNNDAKLAQVLDVLISNYKQPNDLIAAFLENQPYKELPAVPANDNSVPANRILGLLQNDTTGQCAGLYKAMVTKQNEFKNLATGNVDIFDGKDNRPNINLSQYEAKYKNITPPAPLPRLPFTFTTYDKIFDEIHGTNEAHRKKILKKMQALYDKVKEKLSPDEQDDYKKAAHKIAGGNRHLKTAKGILGDLYNSLNGSDMLERADKHAFNSILGDIKHEINRNIKHDEHHEKPEKQKVNLEKLEKHLLNAADKAGVKEGVRRKVAKLIGEFVKENGAIRGTTEKEHRKLHEKWDKFRIKNHNALKNVNYQTACDFSAYFKKEHGKRLADIDSKDINATLKENGRDRG